MRIVRLLGFLVFLAVLAGGAFVWTTWRELRAFRDTPFGSGAEKIVEIDPGTNANGILRRLAEAGVISDEEVARRYLRMWKRDKRTLKAGEYAFSGPLLPDDVLERIYKGEVKTWKFTVPEGLRADEIAPIIEKASLDRESLRRIRVRGGRAHLADSRRAAFFGDVGQVFLAEVAQRGQHRVRCRPPQPAQTRRRHHPGQVFELFQVTSAPLAAAHTL